MLPVSRLRAPGTGVKRLGNSVSDSGGACFKIKLTYFSYNSEKWGISNRSYEKIEGGKLFWLAASDSRSLGLFRSRSIKQDVVSEV